MESNMDMDPVFVDAQNGDYNLFENPP